MGQRLRCPGGKFFCRTKLELLRNLSLHPYRRRLTVSKTQTSNLQKSLSYFTKVLVRLTGCVVVRVSDRYVLDNVTKGTTNIVYQLEVERLKTFFPSKCRVTEVQSSHSLLTFNICLWPFFDLISSWVFSRDIKRWPCILHREISVNKK